MIIGSASGTLNLFSSSLYLQKIQFKIIIHWKLFPLDCSCHSMSSQRAGTHSNSFMDLASQVSPVVGAGFKPRLLVCRELIQPTSRWIRVTRKNKNGKVRYNSPGSIPFLIDFCRNFPFYLLFPLIFISMKALRFALHWSHTPISTNDRLVELCYEEKSFR